MPDRSRAGTVEAPPRVLMLDPADDVAVAVTELRPGETLTLGAVTVRVRDRVRFGHKLALRTIPPTGEVRKYREVIGRASAPIVAGDHVHVHVHNLVSARLPGPGGGKG